MAIDTDPRLRHQLIYSVYVRSHSASGDFAGVARDLDRIRDLGVDVIWLMPIYPCGQELMKGSVGSPYAIADYRGINPEYGTMADFVDLVEQIHQRGMRCMLDIVFNHTSPDARLFNEHPEYYVRGPNGEFRSRIPDWEDVYDLDFGQPGVWEYHLETMRHWAQYVDGFRCDVAPLLPLEFWRRARAEIARLKPGFLWLAETVEPDWIRLNRSRGVACHSDGEMYDAFDVTYDYDVINALRDYAEGKGTLGRYVELLNLQDAWYPGNYVKLRFLENHDRPRIRSYLAEQPELLNWTAFLYFQKGATLLYAGQEMQEQLKPSLFEIEKVVWDPSLDITDWLRRLRRIKQDPLVSAGDYQLTVAPGADTVVASYRDRTGALIGIFPFRCESGAVPVPGVTDGEYRDLIGDGPVRVVDGQVASTGTAIVFRVDP